MGLPSWVLEEHVRIEDERKRAAQAQQASTAQAAQQAMAKGGKKQAASFGLGVNQLTYPGLGGK